MYWSSNFSQNLKEPRRFSEKAKKTFLVYLVMIVFPQLSPEETRLLLNEHTRMHAEILRLRSVLADCVDILENFSNVTSQTIQRTLDNVSQVTG